MKLNNVELFKHDNKNYMVTFNYSKQEYDMVYLYFIINGKPVCIPDSIDDITEYAYEQTGKELDSDNAIDYYENDIQNDLENYFVCWELYNE